ncbi:hypothetical protein [Nonomuraea sp. JJY05]|uniref:hypothetical protein n=1 Tax=Nonomuraea sp. JJY05 TaxID=3350255 RepID=UPI00373F9F78
MLELPPARRTLDLSAVELVHFQRDGYFEANEPLTYTKDESLTSFPPGDADPVDRVAIGRGSAVHSRRPEPLDDGSTRPTP